MTKPATANVPVFTNYRAVSIGMAAAEVRAKLDGLKEGESQDFLVFSDREAAQIYYDKQGKVIAGDKPIVTITMQKM